jgi:hypothetical protein
MVHSNGFIACFGCFFGIRVRARAQNEQKTKKNEEKRRKMTLNFRYLTDFQRFLLMFSIG